MCQGVGGSLIFDAIAADLIRVTRNEAGHPSGRQIDEGTARVHLTIAPVLLEEDRSAVQTLPGEAVDLI